MTSPSPDEHYSIASTIMDNVAADIEVGSVPMDIILRDVARAQVHATLATVPPRPTQEALQEAISDVLDERGHPFAMADGLAAAKAVGRLL